MKGLSFSEQMAKAWMERRKPVTRRLMKPQPSLAEEYTEDGQGRRYYAKDATFSYSKEGRPLSGWWFGIPGMSSGPYKPRYLPGETVYVKETWCPQMNIFGQANMERIPFYKADGNGLPSVGHKWKSPRFMPEWAARSHALIVSVRPERVQEITEEDAKKEGVTPFRRDPEGDCWTDGKYRTAFEYLWNELHGFNPNSFASNPWLWRIELEMMQ